MQASKSYLAKLEPVFTFRVPSKSEKGKYHKVSWWEGGKWECDCVAFSMSKKPKNCKHIDILKLHFSNKNL